MVATSTFRIGIIGAGGIAGAHVASATETGGAVEVVAVADPVEASREKLASQTGAEGFQDAGALIDRAKDLGLGGVVVCTPPSARLDIAERALKAGLPILCEKPLAHTLADAKRVAQLGAAHPKTPAFVAYCHR
ncbi:MAG: gfo/Idh/MocA family oxidoreductase, partial [Phycisphaerales bacterium]